ncbi:50S ribosomal protein L23 [Buchnera aphidicola str. APS (Acyrthosiphon pisum)]|uniref:Large ribosomal subunit protein uL23 n=3 Tax=Buchnera aphidicola TaxID=9 RepID=RL23_BUCAI|nr:50S ribosomal protein L23 [Buchnera aphidicola]B8D847.1 RecName: Full=Large ribosomal subunit protein uL23; AltName: Full=50S ribosomal protein L23 [Buchnera aphidicola str. Tuc7 (Acyrthosiphon pisum)]B8D9U5.1 RecName: Full=Large ribosomal subunit protein uL23; AltName: Full=50S ribosomal protein L23 [Buchnera aphidicola str. 5A (Acyrthosiphon pisum)]P57589.1 RecName: Full=Large ribosomal subunit protein uL23; AltName: Full=50S ribosomal protein L23 [Buchnera aphidicola str. APS (Acyrthosipho
MISEERLLKILLSPHVSEKTSISMEKFNTVVLKVLNNATKYEIKYAVKKIFDVDVDSIKTLKVKGKKKRQSNRIIQRSHWKKAYIKVKKGCNLDFIGNTE